MTLTVSGLFPPGIESVSVFLTRKTGALKSPALIPQNFSLESSITAISGEDKRLFLEFVGRMLKWQPGDRCTAKELLSDPWLRADFGTDSE